MESFEIPTNIKKTLGLLKNQLKKANLSGTCIISKNEIVYQEESRTHKIFIKDTRRESDAEKLHLRMPKFLDNLRVVTHDLLNLEVPPGQTWVKKATYLCQNVSTPGNNQLPHYYNLSTLLEESMEDKEVKKTIKRLLPPTKVKKIFLAAKRAYDLFSVRGPSYLYLSQCITPYVLCRIWNEDFLLLKKEAQTIVQQEINIVLQLMDFAGAQS
ncbi:hypothetical protein C2G38_615463 [Gigaspora rosea]|uniref:Uncharacterized protein n=1 Tax=Gigaspora rosea TaxID=44941 RepID=A0A397VQG4_9GLOM|nr:hypothetical protein C2G38_615463 [Gigaspora rosea]